MPVLRPATMSAARLVFGSWCFLSSCTTNHFRIPCVKDTLVYLFRTILSGLSYLESTDAILRVRLERPASAGFGSDVEVLDFSSPIGPSSFCRPFGYTLGLWSQNIEDAPYL